MKILIYSPSHTDLDYTIVTVGFFFSHIIIIFKFNVL
jgi:hypothetical protein